MLNPGEEGQRLDFCWGLFEPDTLCGDQVFDLLKGVERFVREGHFQFGHHRFSRGQFRRIRRKRQEKKIGGHLEFLAGVPACLIEHEDDELLLMWINQPAELVERDLHQRNTDTGEDQEIALSGLRFNKDIGIEPLILTALSDDWALTPKRPQALQDGF